MATTDVDSELNTSLSHSHTDRWTAPEVLNGGACNEEADIFSFAMVTIEVPRERSTECGALAYRRILSAHIGVHLRGSFRRSFIVHGYVVDNTRQTSATANASSFHRKFMEVGATMLGS